MSAEGAKDRESCNKTYIMIICCVYAAITLQPAHAPYFLDHRHVSYEEEVREFLKRYEVAFDERYVWD